MKRKYKVLLTVDERKWLDSLTRSGIIQAAKFKRIRILLLADESTGKSLTNRQICKVLGVSGNTPSRICKRFVEKGLQAAIEENPRPGGESLLNEKEEALITAAACSAPPKGYARWTLRLLAEKAPSYGVNKPVSYSTIRRVLKKTSSNPGKPRGGASPKSRPSS